MKKILIFGNAGSGKSTLAKMLSKTYALPHLDLDTLAWNETNPPSRAPIEVSNESIQTFINTNKTWVIEGCYADLLCIVMESANEVIFLNPGTEICITNSKNRPWEPHKYPTIEKQNENLSMLIDWIKQYAERQDEFSLISHCELFNEFNGKKMEYISNERDFLQH